jgi:hypothetical protein
MKIVMGRRSPALITTQDSPEMIENGASLCRENGMGRGVEVIQEFEKNRGYITVRELR